VARLLLTFINNIFKIISGDVVIMLMLSSTRASRYCIATVSEDVWRLSEVDMSNEYERSLKVAGLLREGDDKNG